MEIIDGLNALLDTIAERAQEPRDLIALLVVGFFFLAVFFLALEALYRQLRAWRRDRMTEREVARIGRLTAEQQETITQLLGSLSDGQRDQAQELAGVTRALAREGSQFVQAATEQQARLEQLLDTLQTGQQSLQDAVLASGETEAEGRRQLVEELSKISRSLVYLAESMEAKPPTIATDTASLEQDELADLPQDPEARIAALEQRRALLFTAVRDCNRALEEARRTVLAPAPLPTPDVSREDPATEMSDGEPDTQAEEAEQPGAAVDDAPLPAPPVSPTQEVTETDFNRILPEDYERELLRLIIRTEGRPDDASIRLVLGSRFYHVVLHEINERALDLLGDILLDEYEEEGRLVITEEFRDDIIGLLNDRAIPSRRI